jgi:hypothetical protein
LDHGLPARIVLQGAILQTYLASISRNGGDKPGHDVLSIADNWQALVQVQ